MSPATHRFFAGKQLLVFGAGYVGGEVVRMVLAQGGRVTALTRNPEKAAALQTMGARVVVADLAAGDWHAAVPNDVDLALNCVSSGGGGVAGYQHSYVDGMRSILTWSGSARVGALVYTSSTSVYPQGDGVVVAEASPVAGSNEPSRLLLAAEDLLRTNQNVGRWFILRLAGIYGPGRHYLLDQLKAGQPLAGTGDHRLNLIHRDDAATAILATFLAPPEIAGEIFNVVDDTPTPKGEVVGWLARQAGLPAPRFDAALTPRRAVVPDRVIANTKLKQTLGWHPAYADFREGYRQILAAL